MRGANTFTDPPEEINPADFGLWASWTVKEYIFAVLSLLLCGNQLQQPKEIWQHPLRRGRDEVAMIAGKENGPPWKSVFNLPTLVLGYELKYGLCEGKLFYKNNYLVTYFWLSWVFFFFFLLCRLFLFSGFSLWCLPWLQSMGSWACRLSRVVAHGLHGWGSQAVGHRHTNRGTRA